MENFMKKRILQILFITLILANGLSAEPLLTQNTSEDKNIQKTKQQSISLSLGYVSVTGNADTATGNIEFEHKLNYKKFVFVTAGKFIFTDVDSEDGTTTRKTEKYNAAFKLNYNISKTKGYFANLVWERDVPSGISKSFSLASGMDITKIFSKDNKLKTGFGIEAFNETRISDTDSEKSDRIAGYMQVEYAVKLSQNNFLKIENQSRMSFSDNEDYRITNNISYISHINKILALKVIYNHDYKSLPVEGKEKVNTTTTISLMFKF
jgi:putative salt-induced outer membrane protein YdiY